MAQHSNEHLTMAQLSAYLDNELTKDELALCDAHLQTCPQCQTVLADLRVTSMLLHRMPQVDVPRSFVLPPHIAVLPAASERQESRRMQSPRYSIRRSLRALSTLAAVIGLVFILVGALSTLPHGGYATSTAANAPLSKGASSSRSTTSSPSGTYTSATPPEHATLQGANANATAQARHQQTPATIPAATPNASAPGERPGPQAGPPAVLDLGQTEGRLSIGAALLVLGILGVLLTRRSRGEGGVA